MKLSEALEHQDKIKRLTAELNTAINSAVEAVCEYLNSTITDDSFKPLTDVITGKQL